MAVFQHPDGHEIKIAVSGLSPNMRKRLENLPLHKGEAKDGEVIQALEPDTSSQERGMPSGAPAQEMAQPPAQPQAQAGTSPDVNAVPTQEMAQNAPQTQPQQPPATAQAPAEQIPSMPQESPQQMADRLEAEKLSEHIKFAQDAANGKITPKTFKDLLSKDYSDPKHPEGVEKSMLGKLGSFFGLLLSGAGSGLSGQSNAVIDMMNNEIQRDIDAQKSTKENARNFLSVQYAHNQQQAAAAAERQRVLNEQIQNMLKLKSMNGETLSPEEIESFKQQQEQIQNAWAPHEAAAKVWTVAGQHIVDINKNNPNGQPLAQAVKQLADGKAGEELKKGAGAARAAAAAPKQSTLNGRPSPINEDVLAKAMQKGKNAQLYGVAIPPNGIDPNHEPAIQEAKTNLGYNRNLAMDTNDSFNRLAGMVGAGQMPISGGMATIGGGIGSLFSPVIGTGVGATLGKLAGESSQHYFERARNIEVNALMDRLGVNKSDSSAKELIDSLLPNWADTPETVKRAHEKMVQHFKTLEKPSILDTYAAKIPGFKANFPNLPFKPYEKKAEKKESSKNNGSEEKPKEKSNYEKFGFERIK